MKVDVVPFTQMVIAFLIGLGVIIISIIIGACGPASKTTDESFAYGCPNKSHVWSDDCKGVRPGRGEPILVETPILRSENRFWTLVAKPYNKRLQKEQKTYAEKTVNLLLYVNVSSRDTLEGDWVYEAKNDMHNIKLKCPVSVEGKDDVPCESITLAYDEAIDAAFHKVEAIMIMSEDSNELRVEMGDLALDLSYGTENFALFGIAYCLVFLIVSLCVFLFYLYNIRDLLFRGWSYEQIWTLILLFSVVFYNNPLFALEYAAPGWFFPFLDALLKDLFLALLIVFWLLTVEKYRDLDEFDWNDKKHTIKYVVAAAFLVFAIITFSWGVGAIRSNPVLQSPFEIPAVVVLYVLTVLILIGATVWYIVIAILALPKIAHSAVLFTRFLFLSIPAAVIVLSVFIGACTGNFGTVSTSASNSLDTAYFTTLYNVFTWILVFGFWPARSHFEAGNAVIIEEDATESKPFIRSESDESEEKQTSPEQVA